MFVYHLINFFSWFGILFRLWPSSLQKVVLYQSNFLLWSFFDIRSAFVFIVLFFYLEKRIHIGKKYIKCCILLHCANNGKRGNMRKKKQVQTTKEPLWLEWLWCFKFQDEPKKNLQNKTMSSFWCSVNIWFNLLVEFRVVFFSSSKRSW